MDDRQRIRQMQVCYIRWRTMQVDGIAPEGVTLHDFASTIVGGKVASLKELADWELNALRDRLEGKGNKILDKLFAAARAAGIEDLASWMRALSERSGAFRFCRGHRPETLPLPSQWRLLKLIATRARPAPAAAEARC